jgi:hypothetical protein
MSVKISERLMLSLFIPVGALVGVFHQQAGIKQLPRNVSFPPMSRASGRSLTSVFSIPNCIPLNLPL